MNVIVKAFGRDRAVMEGWFAQMHRPPELSMQKEKTAAYTAQILRGIDGLEVETGAGKYGIVATLRMGDPSITD